MGAAPKLEIFQNGQLVQEVPLQDEVWVGRDQACVVRLEDRAISRKHALFRVTPQGVELENRSKFGGFRINGQEVGQATLKDGDRVEMGPYEFRLRSEDVKPLPEKVAPLAPVVAIPVELASDVPSAGAPGTGVPIGLEVALPADADPQPTEPPSESSPGEFNSFAEKKDPSNQTQIIDPSVGPGIAEGAPAGFEQVSNDFSQVEPDGATRQINALHTEKAVLVFGASGSPEDQFEIQRPEISIGRSPKCDVKLTDKRSSREHARIVKRDKGFYLVDLGSANGTNVNDVRVEGEIELNSGDRIQIGDTPFTFQVVQADYEQKKQEFIAVPQHEVEPIAPIQEAVPLDHSFQQPQAFDPNLITPGPAPLAPPFPEPEPEKKKSLIGGFLERFRMMPVKKQIIYGAVILGAMYMFLDDGPEPGDSSANIKAAQKKNLKKKDEKKTAGGLPSYESLTPAQQQAIESQYQMGLELYKNRDYNGSIYEIEKIFTLVQDYKQAREIHAYAIEGKRQLEAREEERKRKEKEAQDKAKLASLIEETRILMENKKFQAAEAKFPDIELLEPENAAVSGWRKEIISEKEKAESELRIKQEKEAIHQKAINDFKAAKELFAAKRYYDSIDQYEEILDRHNPDTKLNQQLKDAIAASYAAIAAARDPWLQKARELKSSGNFNDAYHAYEEALRADPETTEPIEGMKEIRGILQGKARAVYTEGVFAESFGEFDTAEAKYNEVLLNVPKDDDYYLKATSRLKKIEVLRDLGIKNGTSNAVTSPSEKTSDVPGTPPSK